MTKLKVVHDKQTEELRDTLTEKCKSEKEDAKDKLNVKH